MRKQLDVVLVLVDNGYGAFDELGFGSQSRLPPVSTLSLNVIRNNRGMMHDKFRNHLVPSWLHELIGLTEHRIERLLHRSLKVIVLHHAVHCHVG